MYEAEGRLAWGRRGTARLAALCQLPGLTPPSIPGSSSPSVSLLFLLPRRRRSRSSRSGAAVLGVGDGVTCIWFSRCTARGMDSCASDFWKTRGWKGSDGSGMGQRNQAGWRLVSHWGALELESGTESVLPQCERLMQFPGEDSGQLCVAVSWRMGAPAGKESWVGYQEEAT